MTKQEKIQEAYGKYWEQVKEYVNKNGWCSVRRGVGFDEIISNLSWETRTGNQYCWRPKTLQGLEKNNGWIPIKDFELNLKECHIKLKFDGDEFVALFVSHKNCFVDFDSQQYILDAVECFIPIVKPKSPHY